jgi:hypothetical protein
MRTSLLPYFSLSYYSLVVGLVRGIYHILVIDLLLAYIVLWQVWRHERAVHWRWPTCCTRWSISWYCHFLLRGCQVRSSSKEHLMTQFC